MARLVQCCLNGPRDPAEHRRLPVTAGQLAGAALAAVRAGAGALHMHPRDLDGRETLRPAWSDAAVSAVRAACPGVEVSLSTGAWIEPDRERRLADISAWHHRPDLCSVNLAEPEAPDVMQRLWLLGIGVEAGVASLADAERLLDLGVAGRCVRVLVEVPQADPAEAARAAREIDDALAAGGVKVARLHHGEGSATWAVLRQAAELGRDLRVGLEDTLELPDGRPAQDNAELVAATVALVGG